MINKDFIKKIKSDLQAGKSSAASKKWLQLPTETQESIQGQLLHCEILLGQGKTKSAQQTLDSISTKSAEPTILSQISSIRKNYHLDPISLEPPKPYLHEEILRIKHQLMGSLEKYLGEEEQIVPQLKSILQNRHFNHYAAHDLLQSLKTQNSFWPILIKHLFPVTTRINPQPLIAWKTWFRDCPTAHKELLKHHMREFLEQKPDYRMENWLNDQR